jgi:hypothetical protein
MIAKIAAWWNSLPHGVQAVLVGFGSAAGQVLGSKVWDWANNQPVCEAGVAIGACVKFTAVAAIRTGIVAVGGLYLKSSLYKRSPQAQA